MAHDALKRVVPQFHANPDYRSATEVMVDTHTKEGRAMTPEPLTREQVEQLFRFSNWAGASHKLLAHDAILRAQLAAAQERAKELEQYDCRTIAIAQGVATVPVVHVKGISMLNNDPPTDQQIMLGKDVEIRRLTEQLAILQQAAREAGKALELILPLAKGYVAKHPVGSNQVYIDCACDALAALRRAGIEG